MTPRATADSWETTPLGDQREPLDVSRTYSEEEFEGIRQGHVPEDMDDRWFVWTGDDDVVHIVRSWSGATLYEVAFRRAGDGWEIAEAWAARDTEHSTNNPPLDKSVVEGILDGLARGA